MTPTALTSRSVATPKLAEGQDNAATHRLLFSSQGQCRNKDVLAAIIDVLTDKSCSDAVIAVVFKNAYLHHYQNRLNQLIKNIETQHGTGTVFINDNVKRILADDQIDLIQMNDGTVQLKKVTIVKPDPDRHELIDRTLGKTLPTDLCKLIAGYDDPIEISEKNKDEIITILKCGKPAEKRSLIAAASHQRQIPCFNTIFRELAARELFPVNLTQVDLSNLDLTGIDLSNANLSFANLQNSNLFKARLLYVKLNGANLNCANLSQANLSYSTLDDARLIATNLSGATLLNASERRACLLCADLHGVNTAALINFRGSAFNFANIIFSGDASHIAQYFPKADTPVDVLISPGQSKPVPPSMTVGDQQVGTTIVIDEMEQQLLLTKGISCHANPDGTVQLRRALTLVHDPSREQAIDSTLETILPMVVTELISTYDDEIEFSEKNETELLNILKSSDQAAKASIIAAASHQNQISYLNQLFQLLNNQRYRPDLSLVDLSNLNLQGINLQDANLSHAVMHGCILSFSAMRGANLTGANLNGARLNGCGLSYADLTGASLIMANLVGTNLSHATLERARLKFANLEDAEMNLADLTDAWLDHANLNHTDLRQVVMVNTSLTHTDLYQALLTGANLSHAKMMHANIASADLSLVNLTCTDLSGAIFEEVN